MKRYGLLLIASTAACLATPMLPGVISSALHYQYGDPMVASGLIAEMKPFYHGPTGKIAAGVVLLFTAFMVLNRNRLRAGEWIWFALSAVLLLRLGRFAAPFAIVAAPLFARTLPRLSSNALGRPAIRAAMALVLAGGAWRVAMMFPRSDVTLEAWLNRHGPDAPGYPCEAADYVDAHARPGGGRIINEFSWGGYLEWRLGDHYQTLLDGRTQVFSPASWHETYLNGEGPRETYLAHAGGDVAVLPVSKSIFQAALLRRGWQVVYRDPNGRAQVLLPPNAMAGKASPRLPYASVTAEN